MVQWKLTDYSTGSAVDLTFDINPNKLSHPGRASNIRSDLTTASNGQVIIFQGRDKFRKLTFEGLVNSQSFYTSIDTWKDKHYPLDLTDDEGNVWTVLTEDFKWTRVKRRNPWRFDYTWAVVVL